MYPRSVLPRLVGALLGLVASLGWLWSSTTGASQPRLYLTSGPGLDYVSEDLTPVRPPTPEGWLSLDSTITESLQLLEGFWGSALPTLYGADAPPLTAVVAYRPLTGLIPPCGSETHPDPELYGDQAFYCPIGDYIAWDAVGLFPETYSDHGELAISLVLAHEWAHAAQARAGVSEDSLTMELQADCFAGAFLSAVPADHVLQKGRPRLERAVDALFHHIGDPQTLAFDPEIAHGTARQRALAFEDGRTNGTAACKTYERSLPSDMRRFR